MAWVNQKLSRIPLLVPFCLCLRVSLVQKLVPLDADPAGEQSFRNYRKKMSSFGELSSREHPTIAAKTKIRGTQIRLLRYCSNKMIDGKPRVDIYAEVWSYIFLGGLLRTMCRARCVSARDVYKDKPQQEYGIAPNWMRLVYCLSELGPSDRPLRWIKMGRAGKLICITPVMRIF